MKKVAIALAVMLAAAPAAAPATAQPLEKDAAIWQVLSAAGNGCPVGTVSDRAIAIIVLEAQEQHPGTDLDVIAEVLDHYGREMYARSVARGEEQELCAMGQQISQTITRKERQF